MGIPRSAEPSQAREPGPLLPICLPTGGRFRRVALKDGTGSVVGTGLGKAPYGLLSFQLSRPGFAR